MGTAVADELQERMESARERAHSHCVACSRQQPHGLRLDFQVLDERTVEAHFPCGQSFEGYDGIIHGGILATLLDEAMATCILARGIPAYTVDFRIRFRGPVKLGADAKVRGEWLRSAGPLHLLQASISQEGKSLVTARAKFFTRPSEGQPPSIPKAPAVLDLIRESRSRLR